MAAADGEVCTHVSSTPSSGRRMMMMLMMMNYSIFLFLHMSECLSEYLATETHSYRLIGTKLGIKYPWGSGQNNMGLAMPIDHCRKSGLKR